MKNYILLPSDFRNSDKCIDLLLAEGAAGYGVFIMMCEFLRECENYQTQDNPKRIDFALRIGDAALVERVLHNYGLFRNEEGSMLSCPVFTESMRGYDRKREQNRKNALARNSQREQTANNQQNASDMRSEQSANSQRNASDMPPNSIVENSIKEVSTSNSTNATSAANAMLHSFGGVVEVREDVLSKIVKEKCVGASKDMLDSLYVRSNGRWLHNVAVFFNLTDNQVQLLWHISGKGNLQLQNTKDILSALKSAKEMKEPVKYPMSYILSKIQSYK